jgi:hypothetical protein
MSHWLVLPDDIYETLREKLIRFCQLNVEVDEI